MIILGWFFSFPIKKKKKKLYCGYSFEAFYNGTSNKLSQLEMCQDDKDAPGQGHPHPHTGILQNIKLKQCDPWGTQGKCHWIHIIIMKNKRAMMALKRSPEQHSTLRAWSRTDQGKHSDQSSKWLYQQVRQCSMSNGLWNKGQGQIWMTALKRPCKDVCMY